MKHKVAVSEQLSEAVLLGMDLGLLDYLLQLEKQQRNQGLAVNIITRAQARKQEEQARRDEKLNAQGKAQPEHESEESPSMETGTRKPVEQAPEEIHLPAGPDSIASGDEEQGDENGDGKDVQLVNVEGERGDDEWPMPELTDSEEDRKALIEQQKGDKTLESVRAWAERGERGYGFQQGQ